MHGEYVKLVKESLDYEAPEVLDEGLENIETMFENIKNGINNSPSQISEFWKKFFTDRPEMTRVTLNDYFDFNVKGKLEGNAENILQEIGKDKDGNPLTIKDVKVSYDANSAKDMVTKLQQKIIVAVKEMKMFNDPKIKKFVASKNEIDPDSPTFDEDVESVILPVKIGVVREILVAIFKKIAIASTEQIDKNKLKSLRIELSKDIKAIVGSNVSIDPKDEKIA